MVQALAPHDQESLGSAVAALFVGDRGRSLWSWRRRSTAGLALVTYVCTLLAPSLAFAAEANEPGQNDGDAQTTHETWTAGAFGDRAHLGLHTLIGGADGFLGDTSEAACRLTQRTEPIEAAIQLIRRLGPNPTLIIEIDEAMKDGAQTSKFGQFLNGGQDIPLNESLKGRLLAFEGRDVGQVQDYAMVDDVDFKNAIQILADEIHLYSRSLTAVIPSDPGATGSLPTKWASTASPPPEMPDSYWAALARSPEVFPQGSLPTELFERLVWTETLAQRPTKLAGFPFENSDSLNHNNPLNAAQFTARMYAWAHHFLHRNYTFFPADSLTAQGMTGTLQRMVSERTSLGSLKVCSDPEFSPFDQISGNPGVTFHLLLHEQDSDVADSYYLVAGDDGLQCAVLGTIEGQSCALADHLMIPPSQPDLFGTPQPGVPPRSFDQSTFIPVGSRTNVYGYFPWENAPRERIYLVKKKDSEQGPVAGKLESVLGFAGVYGGLPGWDVPNGSPSCYELPITPRFEHQAAKYVRPHPDNCARPMLACNGEYWDARLPLENELSEDGDQFESSWKYYLSQARQAADESDRLVKEYLGARLTQDQASLDEARYQQAQQRAQQEKASQELEVLQNICGTSLDIQSLLKALGVDDEGNLTNSRTDSGTDCSASTILGPGELCVAGKVRTLWTKAAAESSNPEIKKLNRCMADTSLTRDLVHFGTRELCYAGTKEDVCSTAPEGVRCPQPTNNDVCPAGLTQVVSKDDSLQWYEIGEKVPQTPLPGVCSDVRRLRSGVGDAQPMIGNLKGTGLFGAERLGTLLESLSFESNYGGYVAVRKGGKVWLKTGAPGGASSGTLCGADTPLDCTESGVDGLFCQSVDCSDDAAGRAILNQRLIDAGMALNLAAQSGTGQHSKFVLPVRLARGMYPKDSANRDFLFEQQSINIRSNAIFSTYDSADYSPATSDPAYTAYHVLSSLGVQPLSIYGQQDEWEYRFGLVQRQGPVEPSNWHSAFFGGLSGNGTGYFYQRLTNGSLHHASAIRNALPQVPTNEQVTFANTDTFEDWDYCTKDHTDARRDRLMEGISDRSLWWDKDEKSDYTVDPWSVCHEPYLRPFYEVSRLDVQTNEQAFYDALELACEAQLPTDDRPFSTNCAKPPAVSTVADLSHLADFLECRAAELNAQASSLILRDVPESIFQDLRSGDPATPVQGEIGQAVSFLRSNLKAIADSGDDWERLIGGFAITIRRMQSEFEELGLRDELSDLELKSETFDRITSCVVSVAASVVDAAGSFGIGTGAAAMSAAATCGNAAMQVSLANQRNDTEQAISNEDRQQILNDAESEFNSLKGEMAAQAEALAIAQEEIQRANASIEDLRDRARRSVDRALWHMTLETEESPVIANVLNQQAVAAQAEYQRAHKNAINWAFLARRAIEQRLGVELDTLYDDLPLVEAPQGWVHSVCETSPGSPGTLISYEGLANTKPGTTYADQFIGEYVTKLENLVESYRLSQGFQEGRDTAVVSLRDDILNVREDCLIDSYNLLKDSGSFYPEADESWFPLGCGLGETLGAAGALGQGDSSCFSVSKTEESPYGAPDSINRIVPGFDLVFGALRCVDGSCDVSCEAPDCVWTSDTRIVQEVELQPGNYRFSWSGKSASAAAFGSVWVDGDEIVTRDDTISEDGYPEDRSAFWDRHRLTFSLTQPTKVQVGFSSGDEPGRAIVGAPQLELIRDSAWTGDDLPAMFAATDSEGRHWANVCEDRDGSVFRTRWNRSCENLCPDGFAESCAARATNHCYMESSFYVSQKGIEAGRSLVGSGFAKGNFNYRVDDVAFNFVGTSLRDCTETGLSSTCYSGGFIPYSLYHGGPFYVRNHMGSDFEAFLFDGRIEQARGLATERYFSNPIAMTDKELISDFVRHEFRGRPLDGRFTLRVWEDENVDFDAIEDVQVIFNYRYWTRQD